MSFKFFHAADIHLDSPLRGLERYEGAPVEQVRGATRGAFENLVSACIDEGVSFLLLAGDLYDGDWKDYNTGLFFVKQMKRLREAEIKVFIVRGNHDAENSMTKSLRLPAENTTVFGSRKPQREVIESLNVVIHGQSYPRADVTDDLSLAYPNPEPGAFNIGMLHTALEGTFAEHKTYAPCTVRGLVDKGYDYWALGHVHKRFVAHETPHVVFPGNLQGRRAAELGAKGATLVTVDDDGRASLEHRDMDVMRWSHCTIDVESARSVDDLLATTSDQLTALRAAHAAIPLAVRVTLRGATEVHRSLVSDSSKWTNEIRGIGNGLDEVWIEKVVFETRTPIDLDAERARPTPLGEVVRTIDRIRTDPRAIERLIEELRPLQSKLASVHDDDRPTFDTPERLRALLDEVEQLVVPALVEEGDTT
jgi:DNA repair exonuclease SbcCD nuclease subunit